MFVCAPNVTRSGLIWVILSIDSSFPSNCNLCHIQNLWIESQNTGVARIEQRILTNMQRNYNEQFPIFGTEKRLILLSIISDNTLSSFKMSPSASDKLNIDRYSASGT